MDDVEDLIRRLEKRYGGEHEFRRLTRLQQRFLLDPAIAACRDDTQSLTVLLQQVSDYNHATQVSLLDVFRYGGKRVKTRQYANDRLRVYGEKGARRVSGGHMDLYILRLPDDSLVKVEFMTLPDGVCR